MNVMSVSAVTITSTDPSRLAEFYRQRLGVPLELSSHGPMKHHFEGWLGDPARGGVHVAVLKGRPGNPEGGGAAPTFRVRQVDACVTELEADGVRPIHPIHPILDLGDGKRLVSFRDIDGNIFRLIDLGF